MLEQKRNEVAYFHARLSDEHTVYFPPAPLTPPFPPSLPTSSIAPAATQSTTDTHPLARTAISRAQTAKSYTKNHSVSTPTPKPQTESATVN